MRSTHSNHWHRVTCLGPLAIAIALAACGGGGAEPPASDPPPVGAQPDSPASHVALERATVTVNGVERDYFVYAPANIAELREYDARGVRVVISLHDNGQDGQENADRTGWSEVADAYGFIVLFPNAVGNTWNIGGIEELDYIKAASAAVKTKFSLASNAQMYLTGIGAGAAYAHHLAIVAPELAAAVAGVGEVAPASTFELPADRRPVSAMAAWIIRDSSSSLSLNEMKQVAYWSTANGASTATGTDSSAALDTITYAHPDNEVQAVKVSNLRTGSKGDSKAVSEQIWTQMFDRTIRFLDHTGTNGTLHRNESITSMKLIETTKEFSGGPRRWLTYLPSNYDALVARGQRLPVLFSFHGRNGSARYQALITDWNKVAEEEGFIVVYPQGIGATWSVPMDPDARDVRFFLDLLAHIQATYAVDSTRLFLNGSSAGTAMTNRIAVQYPELFAAIAPCYSGHLSPASYQNPIVKTNVPLPVWQCRGEDEPPTSFPGGTAGETAARNFWRETVNRNMGPFTLQVDGRRKTEIWNDGLAEYRWQVTDNVPHFWHPGQARKMWDEMLSKYSRASDGTLIRH